MKARRFIPLLILTVALVGSAFAREAKSKVTPKFPELAKRMNINGSVKVEVVVAPNGSVKSAKALGGHPLLIDAAVTAAKGFKYEAGSEETKESIEFKFGSND
jgi:TonB family protein